MKAAQLNIVAATLLCAGCTSPILKSVPATEGATGLVYALPKGQVQLEVLRRVVTENDVKVATKAADTAKAALDAAKVRLAEATAARDGAKNEVDALTPDNKTPEREKLQMKLTVASVQLRARSAEFEVAKIQQGEAAKYLAEALVNVNQMEQKVTLKALPVIPDAKRRYVTQLQSSLLRDDAVKLSVSNGLLNTTTSESVGQVGNIFVSLVSAVAGFQGGGGAIPKVKTTLFNRENKKDQQKTCQPFSYTTVFDPTDVKEVQRVAEDLAKTPQSLIELTRPELSPPAPAPESEQAGQSKSRATQDITSTSPNHHTVDGLAYRVPVSVTVEVKLKSNPETCEVSTTDSYASLTTTVPDSSATYSASVDGASFTKSKVEYVFKDGMPITFSHEQPSQAAAVARIPIEVLKAIIEVPAAILKLRVDYDSQAEALIKGRADQLKAEVDLINAQKALDDARLTQGSASP